ncbi:hypothetical protein TH0823_07080 [Helicobacter pylori]
MHTSYARYKCMGALYYKLAAFIPNTKDVWDFCLGGLKLFKKLFFIKIKLFCCLIFKNALERF